jgi:hypothetical protein
MLSSMQRVVALLAIAMLACSSGSSGNRVASEQHSSSSPVVAHAAADVVRVRTVPYPEGPPGEASRDDEGAAALFAELPDPLPAPLTQPLNCQAGNVTTLVFSNGETIDYGPCLRPPAIDALRCFIAGRPSGCA